MPRWVIEEYYAPIGLVLGIKDGKGYDNGPIGGNLWKAKKDAWCPGSGQQCDGWVFKVSDHYSEEVMVYLKLVPVH